MVKMEDFAQKIRMNPGNYEVRKDRAWALLEHGMSGPPLGEDIDTLMKKPAWREQALRLRSQYLLLKMEYPKAAAQARKNIAAGIAGPEQYQTLAKSLLALKDTAQAQSAYRQGWEKTRLEEDYLSMIGLARRKRGVPDALLKEGLKAYPQSPGVHAAIFRAYLANGDRESLRKALEISRQGQTVLWPRSVDWKIAHARALLAARKPDSAEAVLLRAMDLLEGNTRLQPDSDLAMGLRQEIFELLDSTRVRR